MPNQKTNTKQKTHKLIKPRKPKKYSLKEAHSKSCFNLVKEIKYFDIISKLWLILYFIYVHTYLNVFIIIIILFVSHNIF